MQHLLADPIEHPFDERNVFGIVRDCCRHSSSLGPQEGTRARTSHRVGKKEVSIFSQGMLEEESRVPHHHQHLHPQSHWLRKDDLIERARKLGISTDGSIRQQISDEIVKRVQGTDPEKLTRRVK